LLIDSLTVSELRHIFNICCSLNILLAEDKDEDIIKKSEENLRDAKENIQEKTAKIVDKGKSSGIVKKTKEGALTILRKPIMVILIIVAIVLIVFLVYTQIYLRDQSYKIENYEALWNQSLADLRSGNSTIDQYCINRVHDDDLCNRFKSLDYFN
jgi:hypothetical protein